MNHPYPRPSNSLPQRPLRILSLDGGGVRGYSMLLLLQEVMHKVFVETEGRAPEKWEIPRPCDHFDLIGGTGTGGLIALLLGRLRVDVATALELWVDMARRVFETDKTLVGIPYGKTLYKASKLEEAIKEVVSIYETSETADRRKKLPHSPASSVSAGGKIKLRRSHTMPSVASLTLDASPIPPSVEHIWKPQLYDLLTGRGALWYDERPGRCKTFVTAVYKGSAPGSPPALLRTYDSPAETCLSGNCTIWEAGRASCAIFPAFKPIQVGQNIFLDEGHGKFNPAPLVLEEAIAHEWPGREIGVFISIGSGKLPPHMENPPLGTTKTTSVRGSIIGVTPLQKFVDARENYMLKIEECEQLHLETVRKLRAKGIDEEAYFRLNVDTGVGQAGMAEWYRLADISTGTRAYLSKPNVQRMNANAAKRLAKIWKDKHADSLSKDLPPPPPAQFTSSLDNLAPKRYVAQPIIPNLAAEFSQLNPPYQFPSAPAPNVPRHPRVTRKPPPAPIDILPLPASSVNANASSSSSSSAPRVLRTVAQTEAPSRSDNPSPPLPEYQPTSARITDFTPVDVGFPVPERIPSLTGSSLRTANSSIGSGSPSDASDVNNDSTSAPPSGVVQGHGPKAGLSSSTSSFSISTSNIPVPTKTSATMNFGIVGLGIQVPTAPSKQHELEEHEIVPELDMDEEVALHFRELQKIAGKIEKQGILAGHGAGAGAKEGTEAGHKYGGGGYGYGGGYNSGPRGWAAPTGRLPT